VTGTGTTVVDLLSKGRLTVRGRVREASNAVLYCTVEYEGSEASCVYKPVAGERPLWDFPDGTLAQREVAAYEVSQATGWDLVPPTVLRDGPYGQGMCQLWIGDDPEAGAEEADSADEPDDAPERNGAVDEEPEAGGAQEPGAEGPAVTTLTPLLALVDGEEAVEGWRAIGMAEVGEGRTALLVHADDERLRRLAVLDAVINNGDRKGGHLLQTREGQLYAIDHGVTFNREDKLRTLLWGWAGEPLTEEALAVLAGLADELADGAPLADKLADLITAEEAGALRDRVRELRHTGLHPVPSGQWPAIPWPPV
jgi:uncharacterized repeat protein (TIGR03843 family)